MSSSCSQARSVLRFVTDVAGENTVAKWGRMGFVIASGNGDAQPQEIERARSAWAAAVPLMQEAMRRALEVRERVPLLAGMSL